jgi:hypothetical protein
METQPTPYPTNDELLEQAEQKLTWAENNYGTKQNDLANTAALISLAKSALVIARALNEQQEMMREIQLPEIGASEQERRQ